jgi:hypothetical protein
MDTTAKDAKALAVVALENERLRDQAKQPKACPAPFEAALAEREVNPLPIEVLPAKLHADISS